MKKEDQYGGDPEDLKSVTDTERLREVMLPTDKLNSISPFWREKAPKGKNIRSRKFDVRSERDQAKKAKCAELWFLYKIDFSKLEDFPELQKLTLYDKLIYLIVGALYEEHPDGIITINMIYRAMGYQQKRAGRNDRRKIANSLEKMRRIIVYLDNQTEAARYLYPKHELKKSIQLLSFNTLPAIVNGQYVENAIHLSEYPALLQFARARHNQITKVKSSAFMIPEVSKTETALALIFYFVWRISDIKNGRAKSQKMKYETIFKRCQISGRTKEHRAKETIEKILRHYKEIEHIYNYEILPDGVLIILKPTASEDAEKVG